MWISSGCYNRHPKSVLAGPRLLCSLRGQILPCLSVSGSPRGSLACGSRAPVCLHLHVASFLWVCMSLCLHMVLSLHFMSNFPLLIRMRSYQIKVYSYDLLGTWLNLQRPYQISVITNFGETLFNPPQEQSVCLRLLQSKVVLFLTWVDSPVLEFKVKVQTIWGKSR